MKHIAHVAGATPGGIYGGWIEGNGFLSAHDKITGCEILIFTRIDLPKDQYEAFVEMTRSSYLIPAIAHIAQKIVHVLLPAATNNQLVITAGLVDTCCFLSVGSIETCCKAGGVDTAVR